MEMPNVDALVANAARFLIDRKRQEAAKVLLACTAALDHDRDWGQTFLLLYLTGPSALYDTLEDGQSTVSRQIEEAIRVFLPPELEMGKIVPRIELSPVDPDWRVELIDLLQGRKIDNQGTEFEPGIPVKLWMNLRFRSASEVKVAEALERAGVLFLPNCRARLGPVKERKNREADFLVCLDGKWGILEVDGEPFHPPSRTVHDHDRDRLFQSHGILIVQHFDAERCYKDADVVVREFLDLLRRA
jgi:hypothetical protein